MLAKVILAPGFRGAITAQQVNDLAAAIPTSVDNLLLLLVPFARCYALPPVSDYPVGVIAQGKTGNAYFGANMEYKGTALSFTVRAAQTWHIGTERLCSSTRRRWSRRFSWQMAQAAPRPTGRCSVHCE